MKLEAWALIALVGALGGALAALALAGTLPHARGPVGRLRAGEEVLEEVFQ